MELWAGLAGAGEQVETNSCSNTNSGIISLVFVLGLWDRTDMSPVGGEGFWTWGADTNNSVFVVFPSKGRNRTTATGRAVAGSSHVLTSWLATTGSTRATDRFSVKNATGPSQGQTTSLYTWRDTYEAGCELQTQTEGSSRRIYIYIVAQPWTDEWPTLFYNLTQWGQLWCSPQRRCSDHRDRCCAGDWTRPFTRGRKLLWQGPNWN